MDDDEVDRAARDAETAATQALVATLIRHAVLLAVGTAVTIVGLLGVLIVIVGVSLDLIGSLSLSPTALVCSVVFAITVIAEIVGRIVVYASVHAPLAEHRARVFVRWSHGLVSGVAVATAVVIVVEIAGGVVTTAYWAVLAAVPTTVVVARRPIWADRAAALLRFIGSDAR